MFFFVGIYIMLVSLMMSTTGGKPWSSHSGRILLLAHGFLLISPALASIGLIPVEFEVSVLFSLLPLHTKPLCTNRYTPTVSQRAVVYQQINPDKVSKYVSNGDFVRFVARQRRQSGPVHFATLIFIYQVDGITLVFCVCRTSWFREEAPILDGNS